MRVAGLILGGLTAAVAFSQTPLGTQFTYQGVLRQNGAPVSGAVEFQVSLWDAATGGNQVGGPQIATATSNADGSFTIPIDFGAAAFNGSARWLEIATRSDSGAPFETLSPRQAMTAAPYALQTRGMFADSQLRVGVGLSNPSQRLDVLGNGLFRGTDGFDGAGDRARVILGDPNHSISSGWGFGLTLSTAGAQDGLTLRENSGNVGIRNTDPISPLSFASVDGPKISIWGADPNNHYGLSMAPYVLRLHANNDGSVAFGNRAGDAFIESMRVAPSGNVGIGVSDPTQRLDVAGPGLFRWMNDRGTLFLGDPAHSVSSIFATGISLSTFGAPDALIVREVSGNVGIGTLNPTAKLDVAGGMKVQSVIVTGGADVAEPFNVNSDAATERRSDEGKPEIQAGMVVVIDSKRVGELRVCDKAYDNTVAGIISGANGVNPGMVLSQTGSVADGKHPVALTGRVWALCDADVGGPIQAGDLLTTSATAGHAMRVGDRERAAGAVIGKAMSSLESGRGHVLVLVSLQ